VPGKIQKVADKFPKVGDMIAIVEDKTVEMTVEIAKVTDRTGKVYAENRKSV